MLVVKIGMVEVCEVLDTRLLTPPVDTGTPDPSENLMVPSMVAF